MASAPTPPGNTAPGLTWAAVMLLIWAFCFYAIRIWVKTGLKRLDSWDYDDTLVSLSFLSALLHVVTVCISINHGFGNRWATISTTDISTIQKSLYASQILYIASLGLTRLSSAFFVTRLSRHEQHKLIARGWLVLCVIWTIASILVISFRGNLAHPWSTVDGSAPMYQRWMGIEISGAAIDVLSWGTSAYLVWGLHMPVMKRIMVALIFATRLIILPFIVLRLRYLSPSANNPSRPSTIQGVFTELVMEVGLMLTTVTCLKPVLRPFHSGYFVRHAETTVAGQRSGLKAVSGNAYYMLSGAKETQKSNKSAHSTIARSEQDEAEHPVTPVSRAFVPRTRGAYQAAVVPQERGHGSSDTDQKLISKTQTWAIEYEENGQARSQ